MSASRTPTDSPRAAIAAARLTVTLDFPTPPLPEATAYTRVREPGWANGMTGSRESPRSCLRSSVRCSSFITSSVTLTAPVPGTSATAWLTLSEISVFFGHAEVVRYTSTWTPPSALDGDVLDHAELGDRPPQLGVDHLGQCGADRGFQVGGR